MKRGIVAWLALIAEALAGLIPQGVVLCVHEDGQVAIESAGSLCCETGCDAATGSGLGAPVMGPDAGRPTTGCDTCTDIPLAARDADSQLRAKPAATASPPEIAGLGGFCAATGIDLPGVVRPRPPERWPASTSLDAAESIVLRC